MKKEILLISVLLVLVVIPIFSQNPPDPPDHGTGGGAVGGTAPLGSGVAWLISMAVGYVAVKFRKEKNK